MQPLVAFKPAGSYHVPDEADHLRRPSQNPLLLYKQLRQRIAQLHAVAGVTLHARHSYSTLLAACQEQWHSTNELSLAGFSWQQ